MTCLEDICKICDNLRKPINADERLKRIKGKSQNELYPYYGATGLAGYIDDYLIDGEYVLLGEDAAPFLDYTKDVAYLIRGQAWVNNHAHILVSHFDNKYLLHYLNHFNYKDFVTGTTRLKLTQASMKKIPVKLPPLPEQHRIVAKIEELFSRLDKGIETLKAAQQQLKTYRQAVLKYAFEGKLTNKDVKEGELPEGWISSTLGDIISIRSGIGLTRAKRTDEGKYFVYGGNGITGKHDEYLFEKEKIIIGRVGVHCGNVHITKPKSWITDNAFIVSFDEESFDLKFLHYLLKVCNLNNYASSTAQPVISQGKIYPIKISFPKNKSEQHHIVSEIEKRLSVADKLEEAIATALQQAEALRQSILKKAFEGKLLSEAELQACRNDPHWEPASVLLERIKAEREKNKPVKKAKEKRVKQTKSEKETTTT
jgi:type I restriction enzyme S subunit